ncbi:MAG: cellulase family glycosylhydrolase [Bacteroidales bacterium]|jgi:endo-1,4-beta-mannosidase|nr:cellulase family glycosylhydrolase [Bacteroidales bacterium]
MKHSNILISLSLFCSVMLFSCQQNTSQDESSVKPTHIYVEGNTLLFNGSEIYLNGANTPWDNWNDFGGEYDSVFWEKEMQQLAEHGMNSTRIWISCDGKGQPFVDSTGKASAPTELFWQHMDHLLHHAKKNGIFIMASITSFDHFKEPNKNHIGWRNMLTNTENIHTYNEKFVIPLVNRYKDNPYLFSIDICNEPEWIHENEECGQLAWHYLQEFAGITAAAIHKTESPILVSIGSAATKWGSSKYEGNIWSDDSLQKYTHNDTLAYMDYWHIHYYGWIREHFSSPFEKDPAFYNLDDKPVVIGETPGRNTLYGFDISYKEIFENPYTLGYSGVMLWTSNDAGIGDFGSFKTFGDGARYFANKYPQLIHAKK